MIPLLSLRSGTAVLPLDQRKQLQVSSLEKWVLELAPIRIYVSRPRPFRTLSRFVKPIHIQLPHKGGEVAMFEIQGKDLLGKIIDLQIPSDEQTQNPPLESR